MDDDIERRASFAYFWKENI